MNKLFTSITSLVLGLLLLTTLAFTPNKSYGQCDAKFVEENGYVIFEAEEATLVQEWEKQTAIGNYTGSGYIVWTGSNNHNNPGVAILDYVFEIKNPGVYRFEMRSQIDRQGNPNVGSDARNDSFVRFPDADGVYGADGVDGEQYYPKGTGQQPVIPGAGGNGGNPGWVKVFMTQFDWTWGTNSGDELSLDLYVEFDNPGVYTMQVATRSAFHAIDRFILYKRTGSGPNPSPGNARSLGKDQTLCEDSGNSTPNVSLTDPDDNSVFVVGTDITLRASANDPDGSINRVRFFADGELIGEDTGAPYAVTWEDAEVGEYKVTAQALDNQGFSGISNEIDIIVTAEPQAPEISITDPDNNDIFNEGEDITINTNTSDLDGDVVQVEFFQGNTLLGTDNDAPFSFDWENAPAGTYSLTARATDNDGLNNVSSAVSISIRSKPNVTLTSPEDNATFLDGSTIQLTATASDNDGTISKVEFFEGNNLLGEDVATPYEFSWANVPFGDYEIRAVATDNHGLTEESTINIEVQIAPTISVTTPTAGAVLTEGAPTTLEAAASDQDGTVTLVEFFQGTTKLGEDTEAPFSIVTSAITSAGTQSITAKATDDDGLETTSEVVAVSVKALPVVVITSPTDGEGILVGEDVTITATASDTDGSVSLVEFFAGDQKIGEASAEPYTVTWTQPAEGDYPLYAVGTDNEDLKGTSDTVNFSVFTPPTVTLTSPVEGDTLIDGSPTLLEATAEDTDGTVVAVAFYIGTTQIAVDSTAPYSLTWDVDQASGIYGMYAIATDSDGITTTSDTATVVVKGRPAVTIINPSEGQFLNENDSITIETVTADLDGEVVKVDFFVDGVLIGTDSTAPFTADWNNLPAGAATITAEATDNDNLVGTSTPINVTVRNRPTVSITNPINGTIFIQDEDVQIEATAADADGTVSWVEFYYDGNLIGSDNEAPFEVFWMEIPGGTLNLTAIAYDNDSLAGISDTISIVARSKPVGTFTNPSAENGMTLGDNTIRLDAQDPDGSITKVEFYLDGTKLGEVTAAPYEIAWPNAALGNYEIYAIMTDNEGLVDSTEVLSFEVFPESEVDILMANLTQSADGVNINWDTQNEVRIASFIIERSLNRSFLEPAEAGSATPMGDSTYTLLDPWTEIPQANIIYYRVVGVGFNGNLFFSEVLQLKRGADFEIQIGPNPVETGETLTITILGDADELEIIDSNGRRLWYTEIPEFQRVFTYPTAYLGRGWYVVKVKSSETEKAKKFIIINPE